MLFTFCTFTALSAMLLAESLQIKDNYPRNIDESLIFKLDNANNGWNWCFFNKEGYWSNLI